jgi:hypothetical protein
MGILNLTPDSFFEKSRVGSETALLKRAEELIAAGADILDIGASSTRPAAEIQSPEEEIERIGQSIFLLKQHFPTTLLSLDTYYGAVAQVGIDQRHFCRPIRPHALASCSTRTNSVHPQLQPLGATEHGQFIFNAKGNCERRTLVSFRKKSCATSFRLY